MTTNNAVNVGLAGATGTGNFVGANTPTLITPLLGTPTSGTLTNCTGLPSGAGILCVSTNSSASAGQLGEFISSVILSGSPVSISNNSPLDLTSVSLTAGDWDVFGNINFAWTGLSTQGYCWISATSATIPNAALFNGPLFTSGVIQGLGLEAPFFRASLAITTTIYISAYTTFSTGACTMIGGIYARRVR